MLEIVALIKTDSCITISEIMTFRSRTRFLEELLCKKGKINVWETMLFHVLRVTTLEMRNKRFIYSEWVQTYTDKSAERFAQISGVAFTLRTLNPYQRLFPRCYNATNLFAEKLVIWKQSSHFEKFTLELLVDSKTTKIVFSKKHIRGRQGYTFTRYCPEVWDTIGYSTFWSDNKIPDYYAKEGFWRTVCLFCIF